MKIIFLFFLFVLAFQDQFYREFKVNPMNPGSSHDEDVELIFNTLELIADSKLQSDCSDLEVYSSGSPLSLFIPEGECNRDNTRIYFTDTFTNIEKTYTLRYGNENPNPLLIWQSEHIVMVDSASCPSSYSTFTQGSPFLRMGNDEPGSGQHTHNSETGTTGAATGTTSFVPIPPNGTEYSLSAPSHTHSYNIDFGNNEVTPPFYEIKFCSSKKLFFPVNGISIHDTVNQGSIDFQQGFSRFTEFDGRIPKIGTTGVFSDENTHTHTISMTLNPIESGSVLEVTDNGNMTEKDYSLSDHTHTNSISCTFDPAIHTPRVTRFGFGKNGNADISRIAVNEIIMIPKGGEIPKGFSEVTGYDDSYLMGTSVMGDIGTSDGSNSHSHTFQCSINAEVTGQTLFSALETVNTTEVTEIQHTHTMISGTTAEGPHTVPGFSLTFIKKDEIASINSFGEERWQCNGKWNDDITACENGGTCETNSTCTCVTGYFGISCNDWDCFSINKDATPCSGQGTCTSPDTCNCNDPKGTGFFYTGNECQNWACGGIDSNEQNACGTGTCTFPGFCECLNGYTGDQCEDWRCNNIAHGEITTVCNGRGDCLSPNQCSCKNNYIGDDCETWECFGIDQSNKTGACSGRGDCLSPNACDCNDGYFGSYCEQWSCYDYNSNNPLSCNSGKNGGECVSPNVCKCNDGWLGVDCGTLDLSTATAILVPVFVVPIVLMVVLIILIIVIIIVFMTLKNRQEKEDLEQVEVFLSDGAVQKTRGEIKMDIMEKKKEILETIQDIHLNSEFSTFFKNIKVPSTFDTMQDEIKLLKMSFDDGKESESEFRQFVKKNELKIYEFDDIHFSKYVDGYDVSTQICVVDNKKSIYQTFSIPKLDQTKFEKEFGKVKKIKDRTHIQDVHGVTIESQKFGVIKELCLFGSLQTFFKLNPAPLPYHQKLRICYELALGMQSMHKDEYIHRNLKPKTIYLDQELKVRIDCISKVIGTGGKRKKEPTYFTFSAPEQYALDSKITTSADIYNYALLIYSIFKGDTTFNPYGDTKYKSKSLEAIDDPTFRPDILCFDTPDEEGNNLKWLKPIITKAWDHNPKTRPTASEIVNIFKKKIEEVKEKIKNDPEAHGEQDFKEKLKKSLSVILMKEDIVAQQVALNYEKEEEKEIRIKQ